MGKSTLFNRITRTSNALVDDRPGITRDRLYATVTIDDIPLTIIDTGGFDDAGHDPLAGKVKDQVEMALDEADAIVLVVDGRQGLMPGDELLYERLRRRGQKVVVAANKVDGPELDHLVADFFKLGVDQVHPVSAAHGYGVQSLISHIVQTLPVAAPPDSGRPIPRQDRHSRQAQRRQVLPHQQDHRQRTFACERNARHHQGRRGRGL